MAQGDVVVFNEALAYMFDGDFASTDTIKLALLKDTSTPTQADTTPSLGDYNQCTAGGNYTSGGETLDTWTNCVTQSSNVMTFDDTGASVTWLQDAGNPTDARWGLIYNADDAGTAAICYIDLGSTVNMTQGDLTITWNASGIFTVTNS